MIMVGPNDVELMALDAPTTEVRGQRPWLQLSASDYGARASNRGGHSICGRRKNRSRVRNNQSPARRRRRREPAERKTPGAAVVAARNYNWALELGTAQSYRCRRSGVEQFQTRMRTPPMLCRNISFP